jgi:transposase InsO family protein
VIEQTQKWLADGVIVPSKSKWNSSTVCVGKKDGSIRVCLDLRPINAVLKPVPFHLPNIRDTIASLQGAKWFTKLDQLSAFTQLEIDEESSEKMTFTTPLGRFRMVRLPFGLATAPAYQQLFLAETLSEELGVSVYVYLDDILIFTSHDLDDHLRALGRVLKRLNSVGVTLKLSKCEFAKRSIEWLGFTLDERGHRISDDRVQDIVDTPTPTTTTEVRQFMGKIAFVKHFIPRCASIADPLYKLTPLHKPFHWGVQEQKAFDELRSLAKSSGVMWFPRVGKPYTIYTDGSGIGCGGWLTQMVDGKPRALAACSRRFEPREIRSHSTTEKEAAAIRFCLESFKCFIAGEPGLTVVTDHKPLIGALDSQKEPSTTRLKRMAMAISEFSPKIVWEAGQFNVAADAVSRQPLGNVPPPDEAFAYAADAVPSVAITAESQRADPELAKIMDVFRVVKVRKRQGRPMSVKECKAFNEVARHFHMEEGALYRIWHPALNRPYEEPALLPYVPAHQRASVFSLMHDHTANGCHQGRDKTFERMRHHFYWPGMRKYVDEQVATCETCQLAKRPRKTNYGTLKPIPPMEVFSQISMDVLDATERGASGARWILVIQDSASALLKAVPLKDMSAGTAVAAFKQAWLAPFGPPQRVITDNGSNLAKGSMKELFDRLGIKLATTEPGRAQGNGRAERAVQVVKNLLTASGRDDARPWDERLAEAVNAYNAATQASTGFAPAHIAFGTMPPPLGLASESIRRLPLRDTSWEERMKQRELIREAAAGNMAKAQARQKSYFDRKRRTVRFPPGSLVRMLQKPTKKGKKRKFQLPWTGPFVVVEEKHPDAYRLRDPRTGRLVRRTVNIERLSPFRERKQSQEEQPPATQEAARKTSGPPTARQQPGPVRESADEPDEIEENAGEAEVTVPEAARLAEPETPEDPQAAELNIPEMEPGDQALSDTPEAQPVLPDVSETDTSAQAGPEDPNHQLEEQILSGSHTEALQEPEGSGLQAEAPEMAEPVAVNQEEPQLRRSTRDRREPDRLIGDYLKDRAERFEKNTRRSNFGIHVLGSTMRRLMRRVMP